MRTAIDFLFKFKVSEKCLLIMDRTNWQYGDDEVNYLVIYGVDGNRQSLLNVELLDNKGGSSNFEDRKFILEPVIRQLGHEKIEALLCDREFFSFQFVSYLLERGLPFVIRIKENLYFIQPLLRQLKITSKTLRSQLIGKFGDKDIVVDLLAKKLKDEYLLLVSFQVSNPIELYRKRWEIECFFKKIKTASFNPECTRLRDRKRLKSLILLCAMAHLICTLLGIEVEQINQSTINAMTEKRVAYYNAVLTNQVRELKLEILGIKHMFQVRFPSLAKKLLSPKHVMENLYTDIRMINQDIKEAARDLLLFKNVKHIKAFLRNYMLQPQEDFIVSEMDELFYSLSKGNMRRINSR